jgi:hypothetical protein
MLVEIGEIIYTLDDDVISLFPLILLERGPVPCQVRIQTYEIIDY